MARMMALEVKHLILLFNFLIRVNEESYLNFPHFFIYFIQNSRNYRLAMVNLSLGNRDFTIAKRHFYE